MADDQGPFGLDRVLEDVKRARQRQVVVHGFSRLHDDEHINGELADAAACYCVSAQEQLTKVPTEPFQSLTLADFWPWEPQHWKPKSPRRDLGRAAALIVAEIERIDREKKDTHCWCDRHMDWESTEDFLNCERAAAVKS